MADPRILIDTSIFIEHLRKQDRSKSILFSFADRYELYVSTVVEFELFMGATDEKKVRDVQKALSWCTLLPLTSQIARQVGAIHQVLRQSN